nr:hypothetical protein GCM10020093_106190 [Planobispora longispora]
MDDLTKISGIGRAIAARLTGAGVSSYADLAALGSGEIVELLGDVAGITAARVEGWRAQAAQLAGTDEPEPSRYESFIVRVLLEEGAPRTATVQHVQTGGYGRWGSWDPGLCWTSSPRACPAATGSSTGRTDRTGPFPLPGSARRG